MENKKIVTFFLVMIDFIYNFQVFLTELFLSQKMRNVLIRVFVFMSFFCAILSFSNMIDLITTVRWDLAKN